MNKKWMSLLCAILVVMAMAACGGQNTSSAAQPGQAPVAQEEANAADPQLKNVVIMATGGTIAGTGEAGKTTDYTAGELDVQSLIDGVPGIEKLANLTGEQVLNTFSDNVTGDDWLRLAKRINELATGDVDGFVITHGTDTLEETAYFLNLTVKTDKPVIVVGAMRPSTATSADGPMNLYQAVALARSDEARGQGVMVVFSDGIYGARDVTKVNAFKTDAFNSKDFGCLGYMRDDVPYFYNKTVKKHTTASVFDISNVEHLPKVGVAFFHCDADPGVLDYLAESHDGIVMAGAGNGACSTAWSDKMKELTDKGEIIVRATRIGNGVVTPSASSPHLIASDTLNPQKARILLALALTQTTDPAQIAQYFTEY